LPIAECQLNRPERLDEAFYVALGNWKLAMFSAALARL
jgi:hypothetical protein